MIALSALAHAKINLFLHIVGKRSDGYHLLQTLMTKLHLADEITVKSSDKLTCNLISNKKIEGENIVLKAAQSLKKHCNIQDNKGADISIKKYIPIAAGLGGGSANAAITLKLLIKLWNISISEKELINLAKNIGADIPFCLQDNTALVEGIGEILTPINLQKELFILLINPNIIIPTAEVYKNFNNQLTNPIKNNPEQIWTAVQYGQNDLEAPAINMNGEIALLLNLIKKQDGCFVARISGSGSTCFGLFQSMQSAKLAQKNIMNLHKDYWIKVEQISI